MTELAQTYAELSPEERSRYEAMADVAKAAFQAGKQPFVRERQYRKATARAKAQSLQAIGTPSQTDASCGTLAVSSTCSWLDADITHKLSKNRQAQRELALQKREWETSLSQAISKFEQDSHFLEQCISSVPRMLSSFAPSLSGSTGVDLHLPADESVEAG